MTPIDLFYSYAHEDEPLRDELSGHLKILERRGVIRSWHDRSIRPGQSWDAQISEQLNTADLVLLLVSSDFINSDYIWGSELQQAMQRHERGEAAVVPVLVRPCLIDDAPFAAIQGLPTDLKAVTTWPNRDEAWTNVAIGIRKVVADLQAREAEVLKAREEAAVREAAAIKRCAEFPEVGVPRSPAPGPQAPVAPPVPKSPTPNQPRAWDAALDPLVDDVVERTAELARSRGAASVDRALTSQSAHTLIDAPHQPRVLWVDDQPGNNGAEASALARLQVEVVAVTSTGEALAALDAGGEPFDALITDWARPEPLAGDAPSAGVLLLRRLRAGGHRVPVICYHGTFFPALRQQRRELLLSEGAFGEAVQPDELLGLVAAALAPARQPAG